MDLREIPCIALTQHINFALPKQTPDAVQRIRNLLSGPTPQLIRIGVRNKGCAGMRYHLEYVEKPGKFDEIVEQDGVRVYVDSKALFSIIGSEMHWQEDPLGCDTYIYHPYLTTPTLYLSLIAPNLCFKTQI
jgi:iron-sulfur cluster assembly 1